MGRMQSSNDLLCSLHRRDVKVWAENGALRFRAPTGALAREDLESLRALRFEVIESLEQMDFSIDARLRPRIAGSAVPLTPQQILAWNWLTERKSRRWSHSGIRVFGRLDMDLLRRSLDAVVWRHESLRTRIVVVDGVPRPQTNAACDYEWAVIDMCHISSHSIEGELTRLAGDFVRDKIDVTVDPLFAVRAFKLADCEHLLIFALDHMISDGVSLGILIKEVWTLYGHVKRGLPFQLPKLTLQFGDYAVWLQQTHGAWLQKHAQYWKEKLIGAQCIEIPACGVLVENSTGARLDISIGGALSSRLREIARRERTILSLVMLTIYVAVMSRWCNQRDLVIRVPNNGRCRPELQDMIGLLATALFLRIEIARDDTFLDLLARIRVEFYSASEHVSFGRIFEVVPGLGTEIVFNWLPPQGTHVITDSYQPEDKITAMPFPQPVPVPFKFMPLFYDSGLGINANINYCPDFLTLDTVEWFADNLRLFAREFARNPLCQVEAVSMHRLE